ncbi:MAG: transglutaminase-like domain-containing protein, partial [Patescibacteria group bacterium]
YPYPRSSYGKDAIDASRYLSERPYWEVSDSLIVDLAQKYKTPEDIYTYVSTALSYDYSRVSLGTERYGAVGSLESQKSALCNEFTDLFIAIARASGIPARRVVGYGYTTNPKIRPLSLIVDVLHTWPEYYDEKKSLWISIDTTWANTTGGIDYFNKLDFSHIAFAINGISSTEPKSAGMYKDTSIASKDVVVSLSEEKPESVESSVLALSFRLPKQVLSGSRVQGFLEVRNSSGLSADIEGVKIESTSHLVSLSHSVTDIPPFGTITIPLSYIVPLSFGSSRDSITARAGSSTAKGEIVYISFTLILAALFTLLVLGILFFVLYRFQKK